MNLQWCRYRTGTGTKYILALIMGADTTKTYLLDTRKIPHTEIPIIRAYLPTLNKLSLPERIKLIKTISPNGYRLGYKTILTTNLVPIHSYSYKPI